MSLIVQAEEDLRRVLAKDPDNPQALNALGYTLADRTDRYQEALGHIQRALDLRPNDAYILDSMGWVQYRLGNYPAAVTYLRRAVELQQDPEVAAHLGEVLWMSGDKDQALKVWEEALKEHPDSQPLREVIQRFTP
jgi:tetratricopeptide (TPR) repeat protein